MKLTYLEQLELDNSTEHLKVVQGNVCDANKKLIGILNIIEQANAEVIELQNIKDGLLKEIDRATTKLMDIKFSVIDKEKIHKKLFKSIETLESKKVELNTTLEDIKKEINLSKSQHENTTSTQKERVAVTEKQIITLKEEKRTHEEERKNRFRDKKKLEDEIISLTSTKERLGKEVSDFKTKSSDEMVSIDDAIEKEKAKIKNPISLIRLETEKLKNFRTDLQILSGRLAEQFKLQNPGKNLPIELQQ